MKLDFNWFQLNSIPSNAMQGSYDLKLVALSYIIAILASYVALDLVGRLRVEINPRAKLYWLLGGAFAMGAGIWSMHFIGMLAFILPIPMSFKFSWTASSLLVAILAAAFALFILRREDTKTISLVMGGILIGIGIASMHYMGMEGMTAHVNIRYLPSLFFLSIAIAIFASEAALWFAIQSNQGSLNRQFYLKIISALIMGVAICGMHYTGMAAAIFTPLPNAHMTTETIRPDVLAIFIAGITALIISLALTASSYYKQMINAVQNEKEFLNVLLDNLENGIVACNSDGKITVINNVLQKQIPSYKQNHFHDLSKYFDLYSRDGKTVIKKEDSPLFRALHNENIQAKEFVLKFKNGLTRNVLINGQPIINDYGDKLGAVIAIHDITEIKKSEKIKSEFVSVVSHELRTPLTSIRGSLGLLLGGKVDDFSEKTTKLLDIANKNCERLLVLINDILDMEKIEAGKLNFNLMVVDITYLVKESIIANKLYCDTYHVKIELTESVKGLEVFVDPERLSQVMANLISNAAKFSPPGEKISVRIERLGNKVRVSISDKGSGIPLEFQSRIFQKFSQADSSDTRIKGGTGLGLSISKAIIENFGGSLSFVSKPHVETTFYFDLPVYQTSKMVPHKQKLTPSTKVLICDPDKDLVRNISALLEDEGIQSDIATSSKEAKKMLDEKEYSALIMDLLLPDQDGVSFIRELRKSEKTHEMPIIAMSVTKSKYQNTLNGEALLIVDWLEKPINFDQLLTRVMKVKQNFDQALPHVLHVEDDIDTQQVIATLLENETKITSVSNIKETVTALGKEKFDLVILDIGLPDGNGCDLIPIFAKYKLPIIIYSAFDLDSQYGKFVREALIKSKITNDELLIKIKKLLKTSDKIEYAK